MVYLEQELRMWFLCSRTTGDGASRASERTGDGWVRVAIPAGEHEITLE